MIEQQVVDAISLSVRSLAGMDMASAQTIAKSMLAGAILELGRMKTVDFNKRFEPFTLTISKNKYLIGSEILSGYPATWNLQELERTDTQGWPITILALDDYNDLTRGGTSAGAPVWATVHSDTATLELYPIPNSAYPVRAYIAKTIEAFKDIPTRYHDVLIDLGIARVRASLDPNSKAAFRKSTESKSEVNKDSLTGSSPSRFMVDRGIDPGNSRTRADSRNLRPN